MTFLCVTPNSFDLQLFDALHGDGRARVLTLVMVAMTGLGSGWTMLTLLPLCAWKRSRPLAIGLGGVWVATAVVVFALKHLVRRARPCELFAIRALWGPTPTDYSFPSGHAAGAFAFAGFVAVLCLAESEVRGEAWRWGVTGAALAMAVCIALSRVYLGVHFPTDVIGGALVGGILGVIGARVHGRR